jgi:hypothetical protein
MLATTAPVKYEEKPAEHDDLAARRAEERASQSRLENAEAEVEKAVVDGDVAAAMGDEIERDAAEMAAAVIESEAFAHLVDDARLAPIKPPVPEVEVEPAEGMVGDFDADSAIAIEMEEGRPAAPVDDDYFFSAVRRRAGKESPDDGEPPPSGGDDDGGGGAEAGGDESGARGRGRGKATATGTAGKVRPAKAGRASRRSPAKPKGDPGR